MGKAEEFFKVNGAKELAQELKELSRGMKNKIVKPGVLAGAGEARKVAKQFVPVKDGVLKKSIKNKVFTAKRGSKGVVGRIGIFVKGTEKVKNGNKMVHPAKYGAAVNYGSEKTGRDKSNVLGARLFLENALQASESQGVAKCIAKTQEAMDKFHAKQASKYK